MYAMIKKIIESSNEIEKVLFNDKEHRKFILHEDELKNLECVCNEKMKKFLPLIT